jgi:hypothetical protein
MTTLVKREDLTTRTALSKSQLNAAEICQMSAWFDIHDRRPFVPDEKVVFGSAVDAGVEQMVYAASRGEDAGTKPMQAALEVAARDAMDLPWNEVAAALSGFGTDVLPKFDWTDAVLQPNVQAEIAGLGPCSGHPDIILADGTILDVKAAARPKEAFGIELGFYTVLVEASANYIAEGLPVEFRDTYVVPRVGYLAWVRLKKPYWQIAVIEVTDELRRYAMTRALAFARARDLDVHVNEGEAVPVNYTLTGGPSRDWKCPSCVYSPANGGPCEIAQREAVA